MQIDEIHILEQIGQKSNFCHKNVIKFTTKLLICSIIIDRQLLDYRYKMSEN